MDPFAHLTPELRLLMLESLNAFKDAIAISCASPTLFRDFQPRKEDMRGWYLRRCLDDDLIQDAMAIINFPRAPEKLDRKQHIAKVNQHLEMWKQKSFPDPTKSYTGDRSTALKLNNLCTWVLRYVDDFLSKATSSFLPQAYRRLPKWSPFSKNQSQEQLQENTEYFGRDTLTWSQQRLIIQSFLHYELLCQVYGPMGNDMPTMKANWDRWQQFNNRNPGHFDENDPFRHWDWSLLSKIGGRNDFSSEVHMLPCIREYILSLYEACYLDDVGIDVSSRMPEGRGYRPEFECAPSHSEDLVIGRARTCFHNDEYVLMWFLMASGGLDVLTSVLVSGLERPLVCLLLDDMHRFVPCHDDVDVNFPIFQAIDASAVPYDIHNFVQLYRRRAWPLFTDNRPGPPLPSEEEYRDVYGREVRDCWFPFAVNGHDGIKDVIMHGGGIWTSRALENVKQRFWDIDPSKEAESKECFISMPWRPVVW